jgi:hypothetical protein
MGLVDHRDPLHSPESVAGDHRMLEQIAWTKPLA